MVVAMPHRSTRYPHETRRSETTSPVQGTIRRALVEALDVIESETPPDAELRLYCAREVARLLASGILARLQR